MNADWKRIRGLRALVGDTIEHGSLAIQRVHLATADRPFAVLALLPPVATPARAVHVVYGASVSGIYGMVRWGSRVVGSALDQAIDVAEAWSTQGGGQSS